MSDYSNEFFRKNLNYLIEKKGLTKKELEKELETGEGYLSRCTKEGCSQQPSVQLIKKLGDILGVTIDQLMYQDLEENVDVIESRYSDETEKLFFEKLINETRETKITWEEFRLYVGYDENYYSELFKVEYAEGVMTGRLIFESMFCMFPYEYVARKAYKAKINNSTEVILVHFDYEYMQEEIVSIYEVYIVKQDKVYPACRCNEGDKGKYKNIRLLWEAIEIDAPQYVVLKAYSDFLDNQE